MFFRITANPHGSCGNCFYCSRNLLHFCVSPKVKDWLGFERDGFFAPYAIIPENTCHLLPDNIPLDIGVLIAPLSIVWHAVRRAGPIENSEVLIMGAGIIGLLGAFVVFHLNAAHITVCEPVEHRREGVECLKKYIGADNIRVVHPDVVEEERACHENNTIWGYDKAFDFSGASEAIQLAFNVLRKRGRLVMFGRPKRDDDIRLRMHDILMKELSVTAAFSSPGRIDRTIEVVSRMCETGGIFTRQMFQLHTYYLNEYQQVFDMLTKGDITTALFDMRS